LTLSDHSIGHIYSLRFDLLHMTNSCEQTLCDLLKQSLFNIPFDPPADTDWQAVLSEAKAQTVQGLIVLPMEEWRAEYAKNIAKSIRILHEEQNLIKLFCNTPIAILKGTAAAVYYPEPLKRTMGDIDFIVPQENFDNASELMEKNGYKLIHPMSEQSPRHAEYIKNGVDFELHHHFSDNEIDIEDYVVDGLKHVELATVNGVGFPMLPPLANGLVLLLHMRQHLKDGLGLRQVIDWMMYVDKVLNDEFWEKEFRTAAEEKELDKLAITVARTCQLYLGLPDTITWCRDVDDALCDQLISLLFSSGNFGRKKGIGKSFEIVSTSIREKGIFGYLQYAGEVNWKAYHRNPKLKPLCWGFQIYRLICLSLHSHRGVRAIRDIGNSKERYEVLKDLGVLK